MNPDDAIGKKQLLSLPLQSPAIEGRPKDPALVRTRWKQAARQAKTEPKRAQLDHAGNPAVLSSQRADAFPCRISKSSARLLVHAQGKRILAAGLRRPRRPFRPKNRSGIGHDAEQRLLKLVDEQQIYRDRSIISSRKQCEHPWCCALPTGNVSRSPDLESHHTLDPASRSRSPLTDEARPGRPSRSFYDCDGPPSRHTYGSRIICSRLPVRLGSDGTPCPPIANVRLKKKRSSRKGEVLPRSRIQRGRGAKKISVSLGITPAAARSADGVEIVGLLTRKKNRRTSKPGPAHDNLLAAPERSTTIDIARWAGVFP